MRVDVLVAKIFYLLRPRSWSLKEVDVFRRCLDLGKCPRPADRDPHLPMTAFVTVFVSAHCLRLAVKRHLHCFCISCICNPWRTLCVQCVLETWLKWPVFWGIQEFGPWPPTLRHWPMKSTGLLTIIQPRSVYRNLLTLVRSQFTVDAVVVFKLRKNNNFTDNENNLNLKQSSTVKHAS